MYSARTPSGDPVIRVETRIDNRKADSQDRVLTANNDNRVGIVTVELPGRDAFVSVIAHNKHGASTAASVQIDWAGPGSEPKPKLYLLAVGVGTYQEERLNLRFPAKDAEDFMTAVSDRAGGLYQSVITYPRPSGGTWTHDAVLEGLDWISAQPTSKDVAMVFLAGHGVVGPDQMYRFLPCDYDERRLRLTTVRSAEFQEFISNIDGKLLIFSTPAIRGMFCAMSGRRCRRASTSLPMACIRRERRSRVRVVDGESVFLGDETWNNGAFTKALVEGLEGKQTGRKREWCASQRLRNTFTTGSRS